jgi:protein TonB
MEADLFKDLLISGAHPEGARRRWGWPLSLTVHAGVVVLAITLPILTSDDIPTPTGTVRAFFVEPAALPAPPPPPPPPAVRVAARRLTAAPVATQAARFTAPIDIPDEIREESALDLGIEGGVPGGVEGGVAGGVVGGVVGGVLDSAPAARPVRVGGTVKEPRKLKNVPPQYPALARQARIQGVVVLDCLLDTRGRVSEVRIVDGLPLLQDAAVDAVRQWVYTPTLINGVPVPVQLIVTVKFRIGDQA